MGVSLPLSSLLIVQNRAKNMTKMTCSCTKKLGSATIMYTNLQQQEFYKPS